MTDSPVFREVLHCRDCRGLLQSRDCPMNQSLNFRGFQNFHLYKYYLLYRHHRRHHHHRLLRQ